MHFAQSSIEGKQCISDEQAMYVKNKKNQLRMKYKVDGRVEVTRAWRERETHTHRERERERESVHTAQHHMLRRTWLSWTKIERLVTF